MPSGPEVLHEIFEAQADARPEAIAVVSGDEEVRYADLESRANRLARHLRGRRVGPGSVAAMLLPRSVDAYAAILGILKSGAAYVPIDPEYPANRVEYILENCGATALVTTADLAEPRSSGSTPIATRSPPRAPPGRRASRSGSARGTCATSSTPRVPPAGRRA